MSNITNLNRDYLIKINVKEATIDVPKMTFWNTDKKTSNMFVQLVINMSTNELISQYVTVQNATDYKITLNVIKPKTKQYKTIEATLLNEEKALFEIDLPDEFTDQVGNYNFEFEVSSKVDNNDESITTSNATYEVKGSILTNLNEEISSSPDLPILKQLIEQVKSLQGGDLTGYQKKSDNSLETTSKEVVGAINEVNSQFKDIANYSLEKKSDDGKLYLKKGTEYVGSGIEFPTDVDLSKVTMSVTGQTLKLMNDGEQIATVEIPTAVITDEQLSTILQGKIDDGTLSSLSLGENSVQTKNIKDKNITLDKLSFMEYKLINLYNPNKVTNGTCGVNGVESPNPSSNYGYTELIPVKPGEIIYYSCSYKTDFPNNVWVSVYDKDKTVINPSGVIFSKYNNDDYTYYFTVPENAYFVRFGRLYNYVTTYSTFIISKEPHSYKEGILYGTEENVVFNIDDKYKHYMIKKLLEGEKIDEININNNTTTKINNAVNGLSTPSPQEIYNSIEQMIPNNTNMCNMKMIGNIFEKEEFYNAWCLNNCFYDKDLDRIVYFYNARDSHEQGRGTIKMRTINKNNPMDVSESSIVCNPLDIDSSYTDYSYVTTACEILSNGTYIVIADLRKSSNNCGQYGIYMFKSVDKGKTWTRKIITFTDGTELTTTSFGIYGLKQSDTGRLHCCHYSSTGLLMYHSDDLGETWSKVQVTNNSGYSNDKVKWGAGIAVLGDNKIIVYQRIVDSTKPVGLCITKSEDDGNTWSGLTESKTLQDCANTPPAVIVHNGMVELCYGTRYIRSNEGHPRIYYTNCTINDAWNDNYKQPKIIGYGITTGQDFGYFGGCADDNGNLHIFYYDLDFEGCNTKYIRGDRDIKPLPYKNKISGLDGIYLNGGNHNYKFSANKPLAEPTYVDATLKYGNLVGNNIEDYLNKFDYFHNNSLTPTVIRNFSEEYNSFKIKNTFYNNAESLKEEYPLGIKVYAKPYTDYIVAYNTVCEYQGTHRRLAVYGKNKKIIVTNNFKEENGQFYQIFNTGSNEEIIIAIVQDNINLVREVNVKDLAINEYKNSNILNKIQHTSKIDYSNYPLYYINEFVKDTIENGVYYKNIAKVEYKSSDGSDASYSITINTENLYATIGVNLFGLQNIPGNGYSDTPIISVINDDEWVSTSHNANKTTFIENKKKFVARGLTINSGTNFSIPLEDLGLTADATKTDVLVAWRNYISLHPTTVLFYYPQPCQVINELPLCIPKDGMLINNNENIDILIN